MKDVLKSLSVIKWIVIVLAIAINIFIIVSASLPGAESTNESNWIVEPVKVVINSIKADTINESNIGTFSAVIRKLVGHFSLFLVSGVLTTLSIKFLYYDQTQNLMKFVIISSISGLFLAVLTETIQVFVPGRSGEITDALIDFGGYIIAVILISISVYIHKRKTSNVEKQNQKL